MAAVMSAGPSPLSSGYRSTVPTKSSPLAGSYSNARLAAASTAHMRPKPSRTPSFPTARPLRPFPSIALSISTNVQGSPRPASGAAGPRGKQPVKLLEPPKGFEGGGSFMLNLTQSELGRRD